MVVPIVTGRRSARRTSLRGSLALAGLIVVGFAVGFGVAVRMTARPEGGASAGVERTPPPPSTAPSLVPTPSTAPSASAVPTPDATAPRSIAALVGQKLAIRMHGTTPDAALLGRIRRGEIGAVILFGENIVDEQQLIAMTTTLRAAAREGGQPPLLVMVDQEGGDIRRVPWAGPADSATKLAATLDPEGITAAGSATAATLRRDGIDVDLAPVEDVPGVRGGFMAAARRTFGTDPDMVSTQANAFARGLAAGGVIPTLKHFPGIGRVVRNTDEHVATVRATRTELDQDLEPFNAGIAAGYPLIMLSNATYDAWDASNAAGWSEVIGTTVLRDQLGFRGVTITDSLAGTAKARGTSERALAVRAAAAGTDMLLLTGSEADTAAAFEELVASATDGAIPMEALKASYERILALKAGVGS